MVVLQLVGEGKIVLDAKVDTCLPGLVRGERGSTDAASPSVSCSSTPGEFPTTRRRSRTTSCSAGTSNPATSWTSLCSARPTSPPGS
ncbi:hypothetical protein [Streptomyces chryseus]|uniref:hypothetical protein n=1 Tax=Streptomyces chryseus TaxID=68186 RepID=UPI003F722C52